MLDNYGYTHTFRTCKYLLLLLGNDGYANARLCYVYMYIATIVNNKELIVVSPNCIYKFVWFSQ